MLFNFFKIFNPLPIIIFKPTTDAGSVVSPITQRQLLVKENLNQSPVTSLSFGLPQTNQENYPRLK